MCDTVEVRMVTVADREGKERKVERHWTCVLFGEHEGDPVFRVLSDEDARFNYEVKNTYDGRRWKT